MKISRKTLKKMILAEMSRIYRRPYDQENQDPEITEAVQYIYMQILNDPVLGPQVKGGGGVAIAMMYESDLRQRIQNYFGGTSSNRTRMIVLDKLQQMIRNTQ